MDNTKNRRISKEFSAVALAILEAAHPHPPTLPDARTARKTARDAAIKKFGKGPLPINPATGKRWINTGRSPSPKSGAYSPILPPALLPVPSPLEGRFRSRRERANDLHERMKAFASIYNAGWMVRDAYFGPDARRRMYVVQFLATFIHELRNTQDYEALLFAVADTLYASRLGVPWEP